MGLYSLCQFFWNWKCFGRYTWYTFSRREDGKTWQVIAGCLQLASRRLLISSTVLEVFLPQERSLRWALKHLGTPGKKRSPQIGKCWCLRCQHVGTIALQGENYRKNILISVGHFVPWFRHHLYEKIWVCDCRTIVGLCITEGFPTSW